jgi:DNA recombination protein RmuC
MELGLLIVLLCGVVFSVILLLKKNNQSEDHGLFTSLLESKLTEANSKSHLQIQEILNQRFERYEDKLDKKLELISQRVNEKLEESLAKSQKTFNNVIERLAKIDEAQRQMEKLGTTVVSLKDILSNNKARGTLGEVQLYQIVHSVFGENQNLYKTQHKLPNGTLADLVLFLPEPTGTLCIDSKFPLDNYKLMIDETKSLEERSQGEKNFKRDIKKHIDDISSKYIIAGVTSDQAIMFIPFESIFSEIHAHHHDLLEYAYKKKVWFASPTTFMAMLSTVDVMIRNIERNKYADIIQSELVKLGKEFSRYQERWNKLSQHIETVSKDVKDIHITTDKISSKFSKISSTEFTSQLTE